MRIWRGLTHNLSLKLASLGLALLLWVAVRADAPARIAIGGVPVEVQVSAPGWTVVEPPAPEAVTVVFSGPAYELIQLTRERPRVVIPVEEVVDTVEARPIRVGWVRVRATLERTRVEDVRPPTVRLLFRRTAEHQS